MTPLFYLEHSARRSRRFLINSGMHMNYWEYHHLCSWGSLTGANFCKLFPVLRLVTSCEKKTFLFSRTSWYCHQRVKVLNSKFRKAKGTHIQEGCIVGLNLLNQLWLLITVKPDMVLECPVLGQWRDIYGSKVRYSLLLCERHIPVPLFFFSFLLLLW